MFGPIPVDRGVTLRWHHGSWWLDVTGGGQRTRKNLKTADRHRALSIARQLADDIVRRRWNIAGSATYTIEQALQDYCPARGGQNESTRRSIRNILGRFAAWCRERKLTLLDKVTRRDIEAYRQALLASKSPKGHPYSPVTVNTHLSRVGSLFRWALFSGYVRENPVEHLRMLPVTTHVKRVLDGEELSKLAAACANETLRDLVVFLSNVGCRISEALSLTADDVDLERGLITIRSTKVYEHRQIKANDAVLAVLRRRLLASGGGLVFASSKGTKLSRDNVRRDMILAARRAGLKRPEEVTPHALRRSWATATAPHVSLPVLVRLGGWRDGRVLARHYMGSVQIAPPVVVPAPKTAP
ncbi:MAG TPA: tyrosine-type recombinase/integrase [Planctomycetota bacterium]|nr:tyrosine-type recombinase/integrase [Planctomycetota bacterium]